MKHTFYEFFAGGGMARAGLGSDWECLFANDFDLKKAEVYEDNWGAGQIACKDVRQVTLSELPGQADLIWGSFPCQDLSLAGGGAGLKGDRSGTFWPFWELVKNLRSKNRGPKILVLENVFGTLRSHGGRDFAAIGEALSEEGFRFGAVIVDAAQFLPQSRPRVFIVAVTSEWGIPSGLWTDGASDFWHPKALVDAWGKLSSRSRDRWIWWDFPLPKPRKSNFADLIEENPSSVTWHSPEETQRLLGMMSPINLRKVEQAQKARKRMVGTIYKRTRPDADGVKRQRAEVRFDDVAGCLRTPAGGSSRQVILVVEGDSIRSRLISTRETARLMGLPDTYKLPPRYNEAYHLTGDGVVVPVVRHLARFLFEPILGQREHPSRQAA